MDEGSPPCSPQMPQCRFWRVPLPSVTAIFISFPTYCKKTVVATADAVIKEAGVNLEYHVGTMIEIPRAALTADEIATEAECIKMLEFNRFPPKAYALGLRMFACAKAFICNQ